MSGSPGPSKRRDEKPICVRKENEGGSTDRYTTRVKKAETCPRNVTLCFVVGYVLGNPTRQRMRLKYNEKEGFHVISVVASLDRDWLTVLDNFGGWLVIG